MPSIFVSGTLKTSIIASVDSAEVITTGQAVIIRQTRWGGNLHWSGRVLQADVRKAERASADRLNLESGKALDVENRGVARLVVQTFSSGSTPMTKSELGTG